MISVYTHKTELDLSARRLEAMERYNKLIVWGRKNPALFIETVFGVPLLDYQRWVVMSTWTANRACWVFSRNAGKSFLGGLYIMARGVLYPSLNIYIMAPTGRQSQETFSKIEDIAKKNMSSIVGSTDVFFNEIARVPGSGDGFTHEKDSASVRLYNGSTIESLVGVPKNIIGKRSHLNFYDEAGSLSQEFYDRTEPFATQNTNFVTGSGVDTSVMPLKLPTQLIYSSSAEDVNTHLWDMYKECARGMMLGKKDVFCADINCDIPLHPTRNGKPYTPLLKQSEVDQMMRVNEPKALREYYNIFDSSGGSDAAVKREVILRNERPYLPVFSNQRDDCIYGLFYDPALMNDNSFVLVGEFSRDPEKGWWCRIINGINLIEVKRNNEKRILRSTEQIAWIRRLMVVYNGNHPEYEKLHMFIDPGSGGGGRIYADLLCQNWTDSSGVIHRGVIDPDDPNAAEQMAKFPQASKTVLKALEPKKYKNIMYTNTVEMLQQDLIQFPKPLPGNGKIELDGRTITLTKEEIRALVEIDMVKEEIVAIIKKKTAAGNISYELPVDKIRRMHDDRAYCLAALGHYLSELRRGDLLHVEKPSTNFSPMLKAQQNSAKKEKNPFGKGMNPFGKRGGGRFR